MVFSLLIIVILPQTIDNDKNTFYLINFFFSPNKIKMISFCHHFRTTRKSWPLHIYLGFLHLLNIGSLDCGPLYKTQNKL